MKSTACSPIVTLALGALVSASAQRSDIGINLVPAYDWVPHRMFADAIKMARGFTSLADINAPARRDSLGWPLEDAAVVLWHGAGPHTMHGTYRLWYTTQDLAVDARTVTVSFEWGTASAGAVTYDAATNTVSRDVVVADAAAPQLRMRLTNTRGGMRNVKLMRPQAAGSTTPLDTSVTFTPAFMAVLRRFSAVRVWSLVDGGSASAVANWADRTVPGYCCQQARTFGSAGGTAGVAWEYVIQLCSEAGVDMYVNIPFLATDDYVVRLATLIRNTLDPARKVFVEYANELWNGAPDYDCHRNHDSAVAEVNRGGSPLNFDGSTNEWAWTWRRAAKRGAEVSAIFRSVFGDDAMMTRVRPLLMTQQANGQATLSEALKLLQDYYNSAAHVAAPHPPSYYFYGAGGSAYYSPAGAGTYSISTIWSSGDLNADSFAVRLLKPDIVLCATFGLRRIAYEGGPGLNTSAVDSTAWSDPRMTTTFVDHHNTWSNYGGELLMYADLTGWGYQDYQWTFIHNLEDLNTPKMQAVDALNASTPAPVTFGRAVPVSMDGRAFDAGYSWAAVGTGSVDVHYDKPDQPGGEWFSYVIRVDQPGTYGVTTTISSAAGTEAVSVDGVMVRSTTVSGTATQTTPRSLVFLTPGLHGIMVRATSGQFTLQRVNVDVESIGVAHGAAHAAPAPGRRPARVVGDWLVLGDTPGGRSVTLYSLEGRAVAPRRVAGATVGDGAVALRGLGAGAYVVCCGDRHGSSVLVCR